MYSKDPEVFIENHSTGERHSGSQPYNLGSPKPKNKKTGTCQEKLCGPEFESTSGHAAVGHSNDFRKFIAKPLRFLRIPRRQHH